MTMASFTIRKLDESLMRKLRTRAARRGLSMEAEARDILRAALAEVPDHGDHLADVMRRGFQSIGGVELWIPPRGPAREQPDFT